MDIPPTILIIVGFIIVVLGIGAGMLLSSLNEEVEPEENGVDQAPPGGRKGRYTPVARLWRERGTGVLVVEMDNKSFLNAEPLSEIQRERLEHTTRDLRAWLGMGLAASAEAAPPAVPAVPPAVQASAAASPAASNTPPAPAPAPAAPSPVRAAPAPAVYGKEEPVPIVPAGAKSIVMQIEDILQDMIAGTTLAHRGLHLVEDPVRGVIVKLDANQFEGIDSVTDPEAKATIRSAVAEWEKLQ